MDRAGPDTAQAGPYPLPALAERRLVEAPQLARVQPLAFAAGAATLVQALSARVHAIYPLAETPAALGVLARREATGKVLVRP